MKKLFSILSILVFTCIIISPVKVFAKAADCTRVAPINITSSATIITGQVSQKIQICSVYIDASAAISLSIVEGTGTNCGTGTAALIGGTSASVTLGQGINLSLVAAEPWLQTQTFGDNLCVLQSGAGNLSGIITYRFDSL